MAEGYRGLSSRYGQPEAERAVMVTRGLEGPVSRATLLEVRPPVAAPITPELPKLYALWVRN
jgi:hypothetical protein